MNPTTQALANDYLKRSIGDVTMARDLALARADVAEARVRELEAELSALKPPADPP